MFLGPLPNVIDKALFPLVLMPFDSLQVVFHILVVSRVEGSVV